ncbi:MAG TPA: sulfatase [Bacteroides sp.]|nr:sulfatase [Bacteroides sp.]
MKRSVLMPMLTFGAIVVIAIVFLQKNKNQLNAPAPYPNIIFIMADDMGYGDIGALNPDSKIPTPNMDRIAAEGMYFTDAHSYSGVCTPTRYGVVTGRYAFRTRLASGVLGGHDVSLIEPGRETVATLLGRAGYRTACVGKWHLGLDYRKKDLSRPLYDGGGFGSTTLTDNVDYTAPVDGGPTDHGFDYSYILPASLDMQPYIYISNKRVVNSDIEHIEEINDQERRIFWRHGDAEKGFDFYNVLPHLTGKALSFVRDHMRMKPAQPFFLYYPLTAPHTPHMPLPEFEGSSEAGRYGDFVTQVDFSVGQLLELVDSLGISGNTLFIVTSDNGNHWRPRDIERYSHLGNYHFRGMKSDVWEGGHRVPFLVRWPGVIEQGSSSDRLVCLTDLLATCCELTGQKLDWNTGEDSFSFLSALSGESSKGELSGGNLANVELGEGESSGGEPSGWEERSSMINQAISEVFAIRSENWKLITDMSSGGWSRNEITEGPPMQLYDLSVDVGEQNNLYEEMPEKVAKLEALLAMFRKEGRSRFN